MLRIFSVLLLFVARPVLHGVLAQVGAPMTGTQQTEKAAQAVPPEGIRLASDVAAQRLVHYVRPVYPQIAQTARVQGIVTLHAIIGTDGSVKELQYISGPVLLMRAAMDAVRQWRYEPFLLNGAAAVVDTTIPVTFMIGGTGAQETLKKRPDLAAKIQAMLPADAQVMSAALGYYGIRDFEAAAFAARDLGIPFSRLKCAELGGLFCDPQSNSQNKSLEKAIHALKPEMSKGDVKNAVKKAKQEAKSL